MEKVTKNEKNKLNCTIKEAKNLVGFYDNQLTEFDDELVELNNTELLKIVAFCVNKYNKIHNNK